ncbi:MAG TPA: RNA-binding domain-containing protein [Nitrosopumilaceae archaeon]|nr:RNA-binding domain-containing protein [Nitrosopumilaceae archaeon]
MKIPNFNCKITAYCTINPSEDQTKVEQAISNILPNIEIQTNNDFLKATSENLETLSNIFEVIRSRKTQRVYRRFLNNNLHNDSTWFYLNKQAAFSNSVALCDNEEESPMGPIKIVLTAKNIEDVIDWLVSEG